ncbi:MAG: S8 family serine peptidase, partial [Actinomycetota bacterium]|nr:S8 family serine peptidase [Actinomycetota bacterium]
MSHSRRVLALLGGVIVVVLLPLTSARAQKPPAPRQPEHATKADANGNKLFDDLENELATKPDNGRVPVIVALRQPPSDERLRGLEARVGVMGVGHRYGIVPAFSATVTKGQARALSRQREVVHVEADSRVRALNDSAQTASGVTAARAVMPGLDGSGVKVAVIDTGVAVSHVDLADKVAAFRDYVGGRATAYDDHGHGTHVAATVVGRGAANPAHAGVAPAATLLAAKVLGANGDGDLSDTTAAIDWAVSQGAQVINLSLGVAGCADGSDVTAQAVDNAAARGVLVAVAAGNEGPGTCTVGSPGAAVGATTVAAMADVDHRG